MIERLTNFTTTMIVTMMMIILIKMIIPEGKSRKYILFVCGVITTIVMLEPLLSWWHLDINEVLAKNEAEYKTYQADDSLYQAALKSSYDATLIQDVIERLKENGYQVSNVRVEYDASGYQPQKLYLDLADEEGYVQPVKIEVGSRPKEEEVNDYTKNRIQNILQSQYGVAKENIFIGRSSR